MAELIDDAKAKRDANRIRKAKQRAREKAGLGLWELTIPHSLICDGLTAGHWLQRKDSADQAKVLSALHRFIAAAMTKYIDKAKEGVTRDTNKLNRDAKFGEMLRTESRRKETTKC